MRSFPGKNLEKNLIAALLAAIALCMLAAAVCRHLRPDWHEWPLKAAGGCLAWMASVGMARAALLGAHVKVSFFQALLPAAWRDRLARFADAAFLLFAVASLGVGCIVLALSLGDGAVRGHPLVYAAIPAGSLLTILRLVERLRQGGREGLET